LAGKGRLAVDHAADVLILRRDTLEIVHLFARGKQFIKDGRLAEPSQQEEQVAESKV
jgi:imidazolonepropionase-like amidohydrolase